MSIKCPGVEKQPCFSLEEKLNECENAGFNLDEESYDENAIYVSVLQSFHAIFPRLAYECFPMKMQVTFPGIGNFVTFPTNVLNQGWIFSIPLLFVNVNIFEAYLLTTFITGFSLLLFHKICLTGF